jgi:hypothetical protein
MARPRLLLAFSGGLDTSFCSVHLGRSYEVTTVTFDCGGLDDAERASIAARSKECGAVEHHMVDLRGELCERILTPLIKFRACRDARGVTGDAMEVRGGCGYIEEGSDPRLLRDAHLGSIWEGTSNIVALDVLRAIRRDGALPALRAHVADLLAQGAPAPAGLRETQARALER